MMKPISLNMKVPFWITAVVLAIPVIVVGSLFQPGFFDRLRPGMSMKTVRDLAGNPDRVFKQDAANGEPQVDWWYDSKFSKRHLTFKGGRLVSNVEATDSQALESRRDPRRVWTP